MTLISGLPSTTQARRHLNATTRGLNDSFSKLSSGYRVTRSQDDAAGMGVSSSLGTQLASLRQLTKNTREATSVLSTSEGALSEINNIVNRIRELCVQFVSGHTTKQSQVIIKGEVDELLDEIDRIAATTEYNKRSLLNGAEDLDFQVGLRDGETNVISVTAKNASTDALGIKDLLDFSRLTSTNVGNATERGAHTLVYPDIFIGSEINRAVEGLRNGYGPQQMTLTDINGSQFLHSIQENDTAVEIANAIDGRTGFLAYAENGIEISASGFSPLNGSAKLRFDDGSLELNLSIAGMSVNQIRNAVNGNSTLQAAGIHAEIGSSGALSILSSQGHDITLDAADSTTGSLRYSGVFREDDNLLTAGEVITVGGAVRIAVEPGYQLSSVPVDPILLDGTMGQIQTGLDNGYAVQSFTRETKTDGTSTVTTALHDTALEIAAKLNAEHSVPSLAETRATLQSGGFQEFHTLNEVRIKAAGYTPFSGQATFSIDDNQTSTALSIENLSLPEILDVVQNDASMIALGISATLDTNGDLLITAPEEYVFKVDATSATAGQAETFGTYSEISQTTVAGELETVGGAGKASIDFFDGTQTFSSGDIKGKNLTEIRDLINGDSTLISQGVLASIANGNLQLLSTRGHDVQFNFSQMVSGQVNCVADATSSNATLSAGGDFTLGGKVEYPPILNQASFSNYTVWDKTFPKSSDSIQSPVFGSNEIGAQTLTIVGSLEEYGPQTIDIVDGEQADSIAQKITDIKQFTGVVATALTSVHLSDLSHDGTLSFRINGELISANVSSANLSAIVGAINSEYTTTLVSARLGAGADEIVLEQGQGKDIRITDFSHSAAIASINPDNAELVKLRAYGNKFGNGGSDAAFVTLMDGGNRMTDDMNATVIGGEITFDALGKFSATSNVNGGIPGTFSAERPGSLFNVPANQENISTPAVDPSALNRVDFALNQLAQMRTTIGAVVNRIASANATVESMVTTLSESRARIRDVDIAEETSRLASQQVIRDAGVSVLGHLNMSSQLVLKLLAD